MKPKQFADRTVVDVRVHGPKLWPVQFGSDFIYECLQTGRRLSTQKHFIGADVALVP